MITYSPQEDVNLIQSIEKPNKSIVWFCAKKITMNKLENARKTINQIDQEMGALYEKRMNAVQEVLAYKKENGLPVFDASREQEVIERNLEHIQNPDYKLFYKEFLHHVMENSKDYQKTLLSEDVVAYAGVQGAFSQIMAQRLYPENRKLNLKNFDEVFKSVVEKKAQYGVIPFENTNSGSGQGSVRCFIGVSGLYSGNL